MADGLEEAVGEEFAAQVHVDTDQGHQGHDQADIDDVDPHVPVDHPARGRSNRSSVWGSRPWSVPGPHQSGG